jgi:N-acetylglucosamine-6-sulfatase
VWRILILVMLASSLVVPTSTSSIATETQPADVHPDIIVILTDDMRADDWPVLTKTTQLVRGTWYPNFVYTTPLCCPTRATIQRGQYAHNTGVKKNHAAPFTPLAGDTIATALDAVGYHTIYVGKYMNNDLPGPYPGWDVWEMAHDVKGGTDKYWIDGLYATDLFRDHAIRALAQAPVDEPLMLVLGLLAPHSPWEPAPRHADVDVGPTINADDRDRKRTLLAVDEAVAAVAESMGPRWDDACVLVLTDNGLLLNEHGTSGKSIWWDEATRVPLLARCAGLGSGTDTRLAGTIDIAPTILRAAGATMQHPLDGMALQDEWDREGILIESWDVKDEHDMRAPFVGIKGKDWLYVVPEDQPAQLYRDPEEMNNVIASLSEGERDAYEAWLADLRDCVGPVCSAARNAEVD